MQNWLFWGFFLTPFPRCKKTFEKFGKTDPSPINWHNCQNHGGTVLQKQWCKDISNTSKKQLAHELHDTRWQTHGMTDSWQSKRWLRKSEFCSPPNYSQNNSCHVHGLSLPAQRERGGKGGAGRDSQTMAISPGVHPPYVLESGHEKCSGNHPPTGPAEAGQTPPATTAVTPGLLSPPYTCDSCLTQTNSSLCFSMFQQTMIENSLVKIKTPSSLPSTASLLSF